MSVGEERTPDAIEPITAFRAWLVDDRGVLWSMDGGTSWPIEGWLHSTCRRRRHDAPRERCSCGLYAVRDLDDLLPYVALEFSAPSVVAETEATLVRKHPTRSRFVGTIVGNVRLAGKVIEHDSGYRAERARVSEVLPVPGSARWAQAVARRYDVPIGDPIPQSAIDGAIEEWHALIRRFSHHSPPEPATERAAPWRIPMCLLISAFFFVNALRGIFMDHGPHWSQWWLWPIAMTSGLVALVSFLLVCGWLCSLLPRRPETRPSPVTSERARPPAPIPHPRPY